jgi:hypothetical protein
LKRRKLKIALIVICSFFLLIGLALFSLKFYRVQTWLGQKATTMLSERLHTKVSIDRVEIDFFNKAHLRNFFLADSTGDTLVYTGDLTIKLGLLSLTNKTINAKSLELNNGVFHLSRDSSGSVNLGVILRRLSTGEADTTKKKPSAPWKLDIGRLELNNIDFAYLDDKGKMNIRVYVPELKVSVNKLDIANSLVDLGKVKLADATVSIDIYKKPYQDTTVSTKPIHFLPGKFGILFDELDISHTSFRLDDHKHDTIAPQGMDFKHLLITDIDINMKDGGVVSDTIYADITNLSAKDRSGFTVNEMRSKTRVTVNEITCKDLYIKTPQSEIKDYFQLKYASFRDFKYFFKMVKIDAHLDNTTLAIKDLNYFVKKLDKIAHNTAKVSGTIKGKINDLNGKDIDIRMGTGTVFKGDFFTTGLPTIFETSLNMRVKNLSTNVGDLQRILPAIKIPKNLYSLGNVNFTGSLDGFVTDFVATGKLNSAIGSANTDLNFKYDKERQKSAYNGNLALNSFDLGKFFNDEKNLGKVSLAAKINGGGLTLESLNAKLEGNVSSITLRDYEYKDIIVDGLVKQKSFNGWLTIRDENLDMDFTGMIDISDSIPEFKFEANVFKACLDKLHLSKVNYCLAGKMNSDFSGNKIDNIQGNVNLKNFDISRDSIKAHIGSAVINSSFLAGGERQISLTSDIAEGDITGNFTYGGLWQSMKNFFNYTLTRAYTPDSANAAKPQNFDMTLVIYEPGNLTRIIAPDFKLIRNTKVEASFNSVNHKLLADVYIPELEYGNFKVYKTEANMNAADGKFDFNAEIDQVLSKDSVLLDTLVLSANSPGGDFRFDVVAGGKGNYNYGKLTAFLTPLRGKAELRLEPGEFKLGNNIWHFGAENSIMIEGKKITTDDLVFASSDQMLFVDAYLKNDTSTSLKVTLNNTSISDFTGIFTSKVKQIKGTVNGKLVVEDVFSKPKVYANFVAEELMLGNELIGDVDVNTILDSTNSKIVVDASVKGGSNYILIKGDVALGKGTQSMDIDVNASSIGLNFLNYSFFEKFVDSVSGTASAKLHMSGPFNRPVLTGNVRVNYADLVVSYLGTRYSLKEEEITVNEGGFDLGSLAIYDVNKNTAQATGRIIHDHFKRFALDLQVRSGNNKFQLLNSNEKQNPAFYGQAYGTATVKFSGLFTNVNIAVTSARTGQGTHVYLPIRTTYEINRYGFYRFVNPFTDTVPQPKQQFRPSGVTFSLELDATPDAILDIILDPVSGDRLSVAGYGPMNLTIPRSGNIRMLGQYEIERGNYIFTLQDVIRKDFVINKGSSINFTGDLYKARLNVDASYTINTSMYELIDDLLQSQSSQSSQGSQVPNASQSQLASLARARIPVSLLMKLSGILENPDIAFDIKPKDPNPVISTYVDQKLNLLKTNENEMNKQVFGLLVMNRFIPSGTTTTGALGTSGALGGTAANTVSEFVSSQFSSYFNNFLNQFLKNNSIDFNLGYRQYDQTTTQEQELLTQTRRELQLALSTRLLNNRLTLSAGGNIDFGGTASTSSSSGATATKSVIPTGNFQVEYSLTEDGRWRAKAFNRTDYDYVSLRNYNKTGIGVSYREEFDNLADLRESIKQRKKERQQKKAEKQEKKAQEDEIKVRAKQNKQEMKDGTTNP